MPRDARGRRLLRALRGTSVARGYPERHRSTTKDGDAGQDFALEPFQESTAGGRNVCELVDYTRMTQRGDRIASTGDADEPF